MSASADDGKEVRGVAGKVKDMTVEEKEERSGGEEREEREEGMRYERPDMALPHSTWVDLRLRLVFPQGIVWNKRVPLSTRVGEIKHFLAGKHGHSIHNIQLFLTERAPENELRNDQASLYASGLAEGAIAGEEEGGEDGGEGDRLAVFRAYSAAAAEREAAKPKKKKRRKKKAKAGPKLFGSAAAIAAARAKKRAVTPPPPPIPGVTKDPKTLGGVLSVFPGEEVVLPVMDVWYDFDVPKASSALLSRQPDLSVYNLQSSANEDKLLATHKALIEAKTSRALNRSTLRSNPLRRPSSGARQRLSDTRERPRERRSGQRLRPTGGDARRALITGSLARF